MTTPPNAPEPVAGPASPTGAGPTYRVSLTRVTSIVILTHRQRYVHTGTVEQLQANARLVLTHNLILGWWGIPFGLVWTPMALWRNAQAMRQIRSLAADQAASGPAAASVSG